MSSAIWLGTDVTNLYDSEVATKPQNQIAE